MMGLLLWKAPEKGRRAVVQREITLLHARFLQVEIVKSPRTPERVLRRRVLRAGKYLRKNNVQQTVLPEQFAFRETLAQVGVQPVSTLALRKRLAADWARWLLEARGEDAGAKIAVAAAQLTGESVRTITELALRHRYVLLDVPFGGEELCRHLRREYGVSLRLNPPREQLEEAELAVLLDRRETLHLRAPSVLAVYDEEVPLPSLCFPPALERLLPEGCDRVLLAAALQSAGVLRQEQMVYLGKPCRFTGETGNSAPE